MEMPTMGVWKRSVYEESVYGKGLVFLACE